MHCNLETGFLAPPHYPTTIPETGFSRPPPIAKLNKKPHQPTINYPPDNPPPDREHILATLRQIAPHLHQKYGVTRLGIFGSLARNEATPASDIDIDIVLELNVPDLFTMVDIKTDLEETFQRSIDLIRDRPRMNPYLKRRIDHDAIYI